MAIIIPTDIGFLYTKALINRERVLYKSVVGDGFTRRFRDLDMGTEKKDDIVVNADNRTFFVSDLAIDQSDTTYHSLETDRFDSMATKILINAVLGRLGTGQHDVYVVSGLPVDHYAKHKDEIKNLFVNEHHIDIEVNGNRSFVGVNVIDGKFIPQPFGVYLDKALDWNGKLTNQAMMGEVWAVWDIGFGTTDVYVLKGLSPIEKLTFSTDIAMNHAYKLIGNRIRDAFDVDLKLHEVEPLVQTAKFSSKGKIYDMNKVIRDAFESTAIALMVEIGNRWKGSWRIDRILLAGGGGMRLSEFILPKYQNMELVQDSQWSVVRGYAKWGARFWGNKSDEGSI